MKKCIPKVNTCLLYQDFKLATDTLYCVVSDTNSNSALEKEHWFSDLI